MIRKFKSLIENNRHIISNFSYLTILEMFVLLSPLIVFPYLIRILGRELYGWVITSQVIASYASILIDFGFKYVSARDVSLSHQNIERISTIISSVLIIRVILFIFSFLIYLAIILCIPEYKEHILLFLFAFGITLNNVIFLDFYFQGIEQMKYITIVNVVIRIIFICLIFLMVKQPGDYIFVPFLMSIGYVVGGIYSLWVIFCKHGIRFHFVSFDMLKSSLAVTAPVFLTNAISTIKDKFNYILLGNLLSMGDVVIYDFGSKISSLLTKPSSIIGTALFPKLSKKRSVKWSKRFMLFNFLITTLFMIMLNLFLPFIVNIFIPSISNLLPIRLFSIAPIILSVSIFISSNIFIPFGKNEYLLKSIVITTIFYLLLLGLFYITGLLRSLIFFVILTVSAYSIELIYRLILCNKIFKKSMLDGK